MPIMRSKSIGKQIDVAAEKGTKQSPPRRGEQSEAHDESLSQTSLMPPSLEDLMREAAPREPPINAT
ncbi:hypothetical protein KY290_005236 [Solanum tuberosum]|uniref:Integrase core domain containing protein n=1 Tax=Solanum tuberosum TaxID=4113 RepID=A0ABQ7WDM8_SOLTU|nr:hypothetical protein KY284_024827 [Solanum tuberosum]KAH0778809.1 hypothetical protein KY290_005236 [Solanum tuberosum]